MNNIWQKIRKRCLFEGLGIFHFVNRPIIEQNPTCPELSILIKEFIILTFIVYQKKRKGISNEKSCAAFYRIPLNFRRVVYCNGIRFGGQPEWDFGWKMLQESNDRRERSRWVSALTCSKDLSLLRRYSVPAEIQF